MLRPRANTAPTNPNANAHCQKCLKEGHWTFECPSARAYKPRPSRTKLLENPELQLPEATIPTDDFGKIPETNPQDNEIDLSNDDSSEYTTDSDGEGSDTSGYTSVDESDDSPENPGNFEGSESSGFSSEGGEDEPENPKKIRIK